MVYYSFISKKSFKYTSNLRNYLIPVSIFFTALLILFGMKYYQDVKIVKGVIIEKKVAVRTGPSLVLDTSFYIHEGTMVKLVRERQDWYEVELVNGFKGWVLARQLWRI